MLDCCNISLSSLQGSRGQFIIVVPKAFVGEGVHYALSQLLHLPQMAIFEIIAGFFFLNQDTGTAPLWHLCGILKGSHFLWASAPSSEVKKG